MKNQKKQKQRKLPSKVFVRLRGEKDEQYLDATETTSGIEDGEEVGIYELVDIKKMKVTEELV